MKIIDPKTNKEIFDPDLEKGFLSNPTLWASQEKYDTIDNITKYALYDDDYELVRFYRSNEERHPEH